MGTGGNDIQLNLDNKPTPEIKSEFLLPAAKDYQFDKNIHPEVGTEMREKFGQGIYASEIPNFEKKEAISQSWLDQLGNFAAQSLSTIVGDTLQGVGAVPGVVGAAKDYVNGEQVEFNNFLTDWGTDLQNWSQKQFPIRQLNPGKAFDVSDFGWWASNGVSIASTLGLLIPATGAIKGLSLLSKGALLADEALGVGNAITKLRGLETAGTLAEGGLESFAGSEVARTGQNALETIGKYTAKGAAEVLNAGRKLYNPGEATKYWTKIAVGAAVSRNAENFQESAQVMNSTYNDLLEQWKTDPSQFDKAKDTDVAKELAAKGKLVTQESLANYIAAKAAWVTYGIDAVNVVFDAFQMIPLLKGFNPATRIGSLGTSLAIKEAQSLAAKGISYGATRSEKVLQFFNPLLSGVARSASEGLEESINFIAQKEGQAYANQLLGKDKSTFGQRIGEYLQDAHLYEQGLWGVFGGVAFEGAAHGMSKVFDKVKGVSGNTNTSNRITEIGSRMDLIQKASTSIDEVMKDTALSPDDKKSKINQMKSELSFDLGFRASQVGNVDLLLQHIESPEFKKKLLETGLAEEDDVDKAITNTKEDIVLAEQLYKKNYNSFFTKTSNDLVREALIGQSAFTDFHIEKTRQRSLNLEKDIQALKGNDAYMSSTKDENVESTIRLEALKSAKKAIEGVIKTNEDIGILSSRGKEAIEKLTTEIEALDSSINKKATLDGLNPDILEKTTQTVLYNLSMKLYGQNIADLKKPSNIKKVENKFKEVAKDETKKISEDAKEQIGTEISEGKHTVQTLKNLKDTYKDNKDVLAYINKQISLLETKAQKDQKKGDVQDQTSIVADARETVPAEELMNLEKLADKIAVGGQDFSPNEVQLQANYPKQLESLLKQRQTKAAANLKKSATQEAPKATTPTVEVVPDQYNYEVKQVEENSLLPFWKGQIDNTFDTGDIVQLNGFVGLQYDSKPNEAQYARNKVMELQNKLKTANEIHVANVEPQVGTSDEFELDEDVQETLKPSGIDLNSFKEGTPNVTPTSEEGDVLYKLDNQSENTSRLYIPIFDLKNYGTDFKIINDEIVVNEKFSGTVSTLFDTKFVAGSKVVLSVDTGNPFYNDKTKNSQNQVPIKIEYNGKVVGYLGTVAAVKRSLEILERADAIPFEKLEEEMNKSIEGGFSELRKQFIQQRIDNATRSKGTSTTDLLSDIRENLSSIIKIREKIGVAINQRFETVVTFKSEGTVVNGNIRGVKEVFGDNIPLFAVKPNSADEFTAYSIEGEEQSIESTNGLRQGVVYTFLTGANGKKIPTPLQVARLDLRGASEVRNLTITLLTELKNGADINSQKIKDIKDKINEWIKVDRIADDIARKFPGYRVDVSTSGEPRVEMNYINAQGKKVLAVLKLDRVYFFDENSKPIGTKEVYTLQGNQILNSFQRKFRNIDFKKLSSDKAYKKSLIEQDVLLTNVSVVRDSKGNKISNMFGSANSFSLRVDADIQEYKQKEEKTAEEKTDVDLLKDDLTKAGKLVFNKEGDIVEVKQNSGYPSQLFKDLVDITGSKEKALNEYLNIKSSAFKAEFGDWENHIMREFGRAGFEYEIRKSVSADKKTVHRPDSFAWSEKTSSNKITIFFNDERTNRVRPFSEVKPEYIKDIIDPEIEIYKTNGDKDAEAAMVQYKDLFEKHINTHRDLRLHLIHQELYAFMNSGKTRTVNDIKKDYIGSIEEINRLNTIKLAKDYFGEPMVFMTAAPEVLEGNQFLAPGDAGYKKRDKFTGSGGIYFNRDVKMIEKYSGFRKEENKPDKGKDIYYTFLKVSKPFYILDPDAQNEHKAKTAHYLENSITLSEEDVNAFKENGYDGVIWDREGTENKEARPKLETVVFSGSQVVIIGTHNKGWTFKEDVKPYTSLDIADLLKLADDIQTTSPSFISKYNTLQKTSKASAVIQEIMANAVNPDIKKSAKWLATVIDKNNVDIVTKGINDVGTNTVLGAYHTSLNKITINPLAARSEAILQSTTLHEIVHALTYTETNKIGTGKSTNPDAIEFFAKVEGFYNEAKRAFYETGNTEDKELRYGISNVHEFMAEMVGNPEFRHKLDELIPIQNKQSFLGRWIEAVVDFFRKVFGKGEKNFSAQSLEAVIKYVERVNDFTADNDDKQLNKIDLTKDKFTRQEVNQITSTLKGITLTAVRKGIFYDESGVEITEEKDKLKTIKGDILNKLTQFREKAKDEYKPNLDKIIENYDDFWSLSKRYIDRTFKLDSSYDIEIKDYQELRKEWEDSAALEVSSKDSISNQIKLFVMTIPALDSPIISVDEAGNIKFSPKRSTVTGLTEYLDFDTVYPYMVRNLIGVLTENEILVRLDSMAKVNPSFAYMKEELRKDANLLAQFKSQFDKYAYDSSIILLANYDSGVEIRVDDEAKKTRPDIMIADSWIESVNNLIDNKYNTPQDRNFFKEEMREYYKKINALKSQSISDNREEIGSTIHAFANKAGIDLSISTILAQLDNVRGWEDFQIYPKLDFVVSSIIAGKKNNDFANITYLASLEKVFRVDVVENSALNISGKNIYTIRNPHFISKWFTLAKTETKEGREEFEHLLKDYSSVPSMQYSNWLWNDDRYEGFLNYEIQDRKKIATTVNWDFVSKVSFHNFGGAKELISKVAQQYADFSENDWKLVSAVGHLKGSKRKGFIQVPMLVPSDSSTMHTLEVKKVALKAGEYSNKVLDRKSIIWNSVYRTVFQEVERIKQAGRELFVEVDGILSVKADLDITKLQQYYHYKELKYNDDGSIDVERTLLNNGQPTGKAFSFTNMLLKGSNGFPLTPKGAGIFKDTGYISLNDIEGVKTSNHLLPGEISLSVTDIFKKFTDAFIAQEIETELKALRPIKDALKGEYAHIGNGTFEDFIAEYVINQYLANLEQFNFFNGEISEYKSKIDTNKRAKQMSAPGLGLATFAMKYSDSKGRVNRSGRTFRAVTIKDIKVKSETLLTIAKAVRRDLVKEKKGLYTKEELASIKTDKSYKSIFRKFTNSEFSQLNNLQKDVYNIISGYLAINAGDAQGYISLNRYEAILKGLGRWNKDFERIFGKIRSGEQLTGKELVTLKPVKGFYYSRSYDAATNRLVSNQIKYSTVPLIPQLTNGTDLSLLGKTMEDQTIDEIFFESAHKVGARIIHDIYKDGRIVENRLKNLTINEYSNSDWRLQLDIPDHLEDEENLLATQIAKLIVANLQTDGKYNIAGAEYSGESLRDHYHKILTTNIAESAQNLLAKIGVEVDDDDNFVIKDMKALKAALDDEVEKRGLSDNYKNALELDEAGQFKLPLFVNNMTNKWESILTSLFTNRIVRQKLPGASVVLASNLFTSKVLDSNPNIKGIEWITEKENDTVLRSYQETKNGVTVAEVLMGSWSRKFFKENQRVSINDLPEEIRTMIGYRIPTQAKHSMIVFKVVGFLPEESKGMIIMPADIVTQMGSDFDIDKLFIIMSNFNLKEDGTYERVKYKTSFTPEELEEQYERVYGGAKKLLQRMDNIIANEYQDILNQRDTPIPVSIPQEVIKMLNDAIDREFSDILSDEEVNTILKAQNRGMSLDFYNSVSHKAKVIPGIDVFKEQMSIEEQNGRRARENRIFDIYKSILTDPKHFKEIFTPAEFKGLISLKNEINAIYGTSDEGINPASASGQRTFRTRNIAGRALKGIAANYNAFGAIAQNTKMELVSGFKFKFRIANPRFEGDKVYDLKVLKKRYKGNLIFLDDKNFVAIDFKNLGWAPDGSYLNVNSEVILEHASQGIGAAVDIVKDPTFDAFNATTYTYPTFHTMLLSGIPDRLAGMFIRQPVLKLLNDYYFDNKSLLTDESDKGKEIETIKRWYQTLLYEERVAAKQIKPDPKIDTVLKRRKSKSDMTLSGLIFLKREDTEKILGYDPDKPPSFDVEELKEMLEQNAKGFGKLNQEDKIAYLTKQIQVLDQFNLYKKAGEATQDMIKATKVDGLGAGPSLSVTTELKQMISKVSADERIVIRDENGVDVSAIRLIYPTYFGSERASLYPTLESYLNNANLLSLEVLSPIFIQQSISYQRFIMSLGRPSDAQTRSATRFLNTVILDDFDKFKTINKSRILGINIKVNRSTTITIEDFKKLSTANKVFILKEINKDKLKIEPNNVLNFLNPLIDNQSISENGYHKLEFLNYKDEFKDDYLADNLVDMLKSGNDFESNVAADLVSYSYVANGLTFGLNSYSKIIPSTLLIEIGLGDYLYARQEDANTGSLFDGKSRDTFYQNNWNNSEIVPRVYPRYEYDDKGKRAEIADPVTGETFLKTYKNTPSWVSSKGVMFVTSDSMKNLSTSIRMAPYVLKIEFEKDKDGNRKEITTLFKKYIAPDRQYEVEMTDIKALDDENFNPEYKDEDIINPDRGTYDIEGTKGRVFYYEVGKLGKDGIIETTEKSVFTGNNSEYNTRDLELVILDKVFEADVKKMTEAGVKLLNSPKQERDELIKRCGL